MEYGLEWSLEQLSVCLERVVSERLSGSNPSAVLIACDRLKERLWENQNKEVRLERSEAPTPSSSSLSSSPPASTAQHAPSSELPQVARREQRPPQAPRQQLLSVRALPSDLLLRPLTTKRAGTTAETSPSWSSAGPILAKVRACSQ